MKRDVKVGLLVAAVVCSLAAVLLGGGLVGREPGVTPALAVTHDEAPPPGEDADVAVLPGAFQPHPLPRARHADQHRRRKSAEGRAGQRRRNRAQQDGARRVRA